MTKSFVNTKSRKDLVLAVECVFFVPFLVLTEEQKNFHCEDNVFLEILALCLLSSLFPISLVFIQHCSNTYLDLPK